MRTSRKRNLAYYKGAFITLRNQAIDSKSVEARTEYYKAARYAARRIEQIESIVLRPLVNEEKL